MTKADLLTQIANHDDAEILVDGRWYTVYSPFTENDENKEMWEGDNVVIALDSDGAEHAIPYTLIEEISILPVSGMMKIIVP